MSWAWWGIPASDPAVGPTYNGAANLYAVISLNGASARRGGSTSRFFVVTQEAALGSARRGSIGRILSVVAAKPNSAKRSGATVRTLSCAQEVSSSGRGGGGVAGLLTVITESARPGRRLGSISRTMIAARILSDPYKRIASLARLLAATKFNGTGGRVPPAIVEPAGKSIMRNKIRVLDNDRYSSRGVQFDGDNSFTVKLTKNEAGRLEIYYEHLLEAGDYVVSCVATINGETPPVISLNVAGTIATMIISGGGFDREMTIVATTFFGLADEIKLCVRDYVRPRARPRDY